MRQRQATARPPRHPANPAWLLLRRHHRTRHGRQTAAAGLRLTMALGPMTPRRQQGATKRKADQSRWPPPEPWRWEKTARDNCPPEPDEPTSHIPDLHAEFMDRRLAG